MATSILKQPRSVDYIAVVDRVDTWASKNVEIPGADFTYVLLGLKSLFR
jgi:hypothetical protein